MTPWAAWTDQCGACSGSPQLQSTTQLRGIFCGSKHLLNLHFLWLSSDLLFCHLLLLVVMATTLLPLLLLLLLLLKVGEKGGGREGWEDERKEGREGRQEGEGKRKREEWMVRGQRVRTVRSGESGHTEKADILPVIEHTVYGSQKATTEVHTSAGFTTSFLSCPRGSFFTSSSCR